MAVTIQGTRDNINVLENNQLIAALPQYVAQGFEHIRIQDLPQALKQKGYI